MVTLSPVVKLDDKNTFEVIRVVPIELATVRLQDAILKSTFRFKKTFNEIISVGGLHNFLNFQGKILLSFVMRDEIIAKFNPNKYAAVIKSLNPDLYTTIDGETYEGEFSLSLKEIGRIHKQNKELLALCPDYHPVGLVKGCSMKQIDYHIMLLKSLGIVDFIFHTGDFFRHGNPEMISRARNYLIRIRKHARHLYLYGMGSQKRLLEFSFADVYISFKHFVTARNGYRFVGTKTMKYKGSFVPQIVTDNFIEMYKNVKDLDKQVKLL